MGGKSKSATTANTSTTTNTTTNNVQDIDTTSIGLEDNEFAVVGGGDVSVVQNTTDFGAVEAGIKAAQAGTDAALDFGDEVVDAGFGFGERALDSVDDTVKAGFDFGTRALDSVTASSAASTSKLASAIDQVAAATRSDAADSFNKVTKYGTIAVGVVVAGVVAVMLFKKRGS